MIKKSMKRAEAGNLSSIRVEENLSSPANFTNLLHRLDHSNLIVYHHHTHLWKQVKIFLGSKCFFYQAGVRPKGSFELFQINETTAQDIHYRTGRNFIICMCKYCLYFFSTSDGHDSDIVSTWAAQGGRSHQYPHSPESCSCQERT